jgi:hypothetical protein
MRYTLSEEEREARRRATAAMAKCACGNVARHGTTQCGRCAGEQDQRQSLLTLIDGLDPGAEDFGPDLRYLLRVLLNFSA